MCSPATPNPNTSQNITTQTALPQWYQDYLTSTLGQAQNVAATPYQAYGGQEVANLTPDQLQAQSQVEGMQGSYQPTLDASGALYSGVGAANTNGALSGALSDAGNAGSGSYQNANSLLGNAASDFGQAGNTNSAGQYTPYQMAATRSTAQAGQQADPLIQGSTNPLGLGAASPYLSAASQPVSQDISQYMSPYTGSVVNAIAQQSARNLSENLMPALDNQFIAAGQNGSTRQQQLAQNLVRDTNQDTLNQQAQALESGYNEAGSLAEQDTARQAQLAGTAGGLGSQQQSQMLQAGSTLGNLSLGQGSQYNQLGLGGANTAAQQAGLQLQAGQGLNSAGSTLAGIGTAQAGQAMNLAQLMSSNYNTNQNQQLQAAQGLSGLAQTQTGLGLQDAAALQAAGQTQQQQQQTSLNTAYQDFLNQKNYPIQMTDFLSSIVHGLPVNTSSYQSQTGPATTSQLQPSALGQVAGAGISAYGLTKGLGGYDGGAVRKNSIGKNRKKMTPRGVGSLAKAA